MAITLLNLRSFIAGQQPTALEPGQICFNLTDRLMYVGDGSNSNSNFNGGLTPGTPGLSWFSLPMDLAGLGESLLVSPDAYGQLPSDGDTLQWNTGLNHLEWVSQVTPGTGSAGFLMTNAEVVSATGSNVSQKINSVISPNVATSGNTAVVQGISGDLYEGVYISIGGSWEFGAFYAQPVAAAIDYNNSVSGLSASDVQSAIDELSTKKVDSPLIPPLPTQVLSWNGTETEWTSDGGGSVQGVTGTAPILVDNTDSANPVISVTSASILTPGAVQLNDTTFSTSTTQAATANAVKNTYDLASVAEVDAQQALFDAAAAQSTANTAQSDATQALADAAAAQVDATQALADAAAAQGDATQALANAAAAQVTANAALPKAGGIMTGNLVFASGQTTATILAPNIVQLLDSTSSNSITTAATPNSVRAAYTLASDALARTGGTMTGIVTFASGQQFPISGIQGGSTTQTGVVQLLDSVSSTSNAYAATPNAVKTAYDAAVTAQATANAALPKAGGTMSGFIVFAAGQTFPSSSIADATTSTKGVVQIGANIGVSSGIISVADGNIAAKGVVQLTDALNSTSTTLGLTANGGYLLQQQIDTLSLLSNLTFCGTINASTGLLTSVTDAGIAHGFTVGLPLPAPAALTNDHFVVVSVPGTFTPTGGSGPVVCNQGDWIVGTEPTPAAYEWSLQPVGYDAPSATTTTEGVTFLATNVEVQSGTDTSNKAVNPASLQSKLSDSVSTTSSTTIASSTAVKTAYDLADAAIPKATFTAKGQVIAGTGTSTYAALTVGTNGYVLTADSTETSGLKWSAIPSGPGSAQPSVEGLVYGLTQNSVSGYNVSLGYGANSTLTTGVGNTVLGGAAGDITSGSYNVAIGFDVNVNDPAGDKQLAIGPDAYTRWLTGDSSMNVKIGAGLVDATNSTGTAGQILSSTGTALQWSTLAATPDATPIVAGVVLGCTTAFNSALGCSALVSNTDGNANTAVGVYALCSNTTGNQNTANGSFALFCTTIGNVNTANGSSALSSNTTGCTNTATGANALTCNISGNANTATGTSALFCNTTGSGNIATGINALFNTTTGSFNVSLGFYAGCAITTGCCNVIIGPFAAAASGTGSCQLAIGFSSTDNWLTGDSTKAIKPGAGLRDATDSLGTAGQVLSSTGTALQWINNTADGVLGVTGTTPVNVDNTDPQNPVISVGAGTTTTTGVVQLEDSISSISTTTAATPNSVKTVYDLADAALPRTGGTMTGDIVFANGQPVDAGFF